MHDGHRQEAKAPRAAKACRSLEPSPEDDRVAAVIVHAAYTVHKALGPGLLESVVGHVSAASSAKAASDVRSLASLGFLASLR